MRSPVLSNLKSHTVARGAALILPAALSLAALAGVTARPAVSVAEARIALRAAEVRVDEWQLERERLDAFLAARGFERIERAVEHLRSAVPEGLDPVVVYGLLRVASESRGIALEAMHLGAESDLGLSGPRDRILSLDVDVSGDATLGQLVAFVETVRSLGLPAVVRDVSLERTSPAEREFHFRMTLGLLHFAPPDETGEETELDLTELEGEA